jgi:hypothetical protein
MKARPARFCRLLAAPTIGVFLSAIGCSVSDDADPSVIEEQEAMSTEEESGITDESALEATAADALTVSVVKGRCYARPNCIVLLSSSVTAQECKFKLRGKSWRRSLPFRRCLPLF